MSSVDVIVPCYRYGHYLQQCVESVLTQEKTVVRVLIIDDASPDNTAEVATSLCHQDARVSFVHRQINKGHIAAYNEGIDWVSADYYMVLSADDYLLPGALHRATKLLDKHSEVGLVFGQAIVSRDDSESSASAEDDVNSGWQIISGLEFIKRSGARNIVPTPTAIVRTELQKRVGGYLPELPHSGDMELWLRLAAHSSVGNLEAKQAVYRQHAGNMSLSYTTTSWLPDLLQRKAAIDQFIRRCKGVLPGWEKIHQDLARSLARDAVGFASTAFNRCDLELSKQFAEFARTESPSIIRSPSWIKFRLKQFLGVKQWQAFEPWIAHVRRFLSA
jgi:glycosyltransferase involved in cell wall biosynthesis